MSQTYVLRRVSEIAQSSPKMQKYAPKALSPCSADCSFRGIPCSSQAVGNTKLFLLLPLHWTSNAPHSELSVMKVKYHTAMLPTCFWLYICFSNEILLKDLHRERGISKPTQRNTQVTTSVSLPSFVILKFGLKRPREVKLHALQFTETFVRLRASEANCNEACCNMDICLLSLAHLFPYK